VLKRPSERVGGWRQRARKVGCMKQGDLLASKSVGRAGVGAPIVAMKPGNAGGAKGCRKMETRWPNFAGPSPAANAREGYTSRRDHEASLPHQEWSWIEPRIWTERLLAASHQGSKAARGASGPVRLLCRAWAFPLALRPCFGPPVLLQVTPSTGEPDAGDPPVRFGGRGWRTQSLLPTPTRASDGTSTLDSRLRGNDDISV
jgi:hypothetical protein